MRQRPINFDDVFDRYGQSLRGNPGVDPIYNAVQQAQLDAIPPPEYVEAEPSQFGVSITDPPQWTKHLISKSVLDDGTYNPRGQTYRYRIRPKPYEDITAGESREAANRRAQTIADRGSYDRRRLIYNSRPDLLPYYDQYGIEEYIVPPTSVSRAEIEAELTGSTPIRDYLMSRYTNTFQGDLVNRAQKRYELIQTIDGGHRYIQRRGTHHMEPFAYPI